MKDLRHERGSARVLLFTEQCVDRPPETSTARDVHDHRTSVLDSRYPVSDVANIGLQADKPISIVDQVN